MKNIKACFLILALVLLATGLPGGAGQAARYAPQDPVYIPALMSHYGPLVNKIVYASGYTDAGKIYNLFVMNPDGSGQIQLTHSTTWSYIAPAISPDGLRVAFTGNPPSGSSEMQSLFIMNADGSDLKNLVPVTVSGNHSHPSWSPDGKKVVFTSDLYNPGPDTANAIYTLALDGSNAINRLTDRTTASDSQPAWSPDGTRIAWVVFDLATQHDQVWVMNANGSGMINVSNSTTDDDGPAWSPDSQKIAFHRDLGSSSAHNRQIFVVNRDGSGLTQLTFNSRQNLYPFWAPDASKVAYQSFASGYADLFTITINGASSVNLTDHGSAFASIQGDWR